MILAHDDVLSATESVANWLMLFSDERFRNRSAAEYHDHNFIREHCRIGFARFISNTIDEAILQILSKAAISHEPLLLGSPYSPCHWGALAVVFHLFQGGNFDLRRSRRVFWLTTERRERTLFHRLRMQSRFRRVTDGLVVNEGVPQAECAADRTQLVIVRCLDELEAAHGSDTIVVSDARGQLAFRKGEPEALVNKLQTLSRRSVLILPSKDLTADLGHLAFCWPWSEAAIKNGLASANYDRQTIPGQWALGAVHAGETNRRVITVRGLKDLEDRLLELKDVTYRVFSRPKNFLDTRLMMEFQRIVGILRQLAIPIDFHEASDDRQTLTARLRRLESNARLASRDVGEYIQIGLMYIAEAMRLLQATGGKWELLRDTVAAAVRQDRNIGLAFPQADDYSAERTLLYVTEFVEAQGGRQSKVVLISDPSELPLFAGDAILTGVPKLASASRWRIPFEGSLTILTWQFDRVFAFLALRGSLWNAERLRRQAWRAHFETPVDRYQPRSEQIGVIERFAEDVSIDSAPSEIEAFDPSYRGGSTVARSIDDAILAKAGYTLVFDEGDRIRCLAGEGQYVVSSNFGGDIIRRKMTNELSVGDHIALIDGESYEQLSSRLQMEADRVSGLMSFKELWERWQILCLERDENPTVREEFIRRIREIGCQRSVQAIRSWLRLQVMGPEDCEDIVFVALAAEDYDLARNAKDLWRGLHDRRVRHRKLGRWLTAALRQSASADASLRDKIVDANLGLTFGDLQRGVTVKRIALIHPPAQEVKDG